MRSIAAPILILAAGTLGTNELLLKAQARGVPLSSKVGTRFSANGDDLVLAMQLATPVNAVATWRRLVSARRCCLHNERTIPPIQ